MRADGRMDVRCGKARQMRCAGGSKVWEPSQGAVGRGMEGEALKFGVRRCRLVSGLRDGRGHTLIRYWLYPYCRYLDG